ncbi:MAG: hypothetical protein AAFQ82_07570 [Myxococcota bacterium]
MTKTAPISSAATAAASTATAESVSTESAAKAKGRTPHYQSGSTRPGDEIVREPPNDARFISGHAPRSDGYPRGDSHTPHFMEGDDRGSHGREEFLG